MKKKSDSEQQGAGKKTDNRRAARRSTTSSEEVERMNEGEWLACADPFGMVDFLGPARSERKFRLFGCACVRGVWEYLSDVLRQATETCERFADGLATVEELRAAEAMADAAYEGWGDAIADHGAIAVSALCSRKPWFPMGDGSSGGIAAVAGFAWSNEKTPFHIANQKAKKVHCGLLRDLFGNPFRTVTLDRRRLPAAVKQLAGTIYEERAFERLPILADALEETGHTQADILNHFRQPGVHVRGCWGLDLLLGKE